jgi:hypothetical protein
MVGFRVGGGCPSGARQWLVPNHAGKDDFSEQSIRLFYAKFHSISCFPLGFSKWCFSNGPRISRLIDGNRPPIADGPPGTTESYRFDRERGFAAP